MSVTFAGAAGVAGARGGRGGANFTTSFVLGRQSRMLGTTACLPGDAGWPPDPPKTQAEPALPRDRRLETIARPRGPPRSSHSAPQALVPTAQQGYICTSRSRRTAPRASARPPSCQRPNQHEEEAGRAGSPASRAPNYYTVLETRVLRRGGDWAVRAGRKWWLMRTWAAGVAAGPRGTPTL